MHIFAKAVLERTCTGEQKNWWLIGMANKIISESPD